MCFTSRFWLGDGVLHKLTLSKKLKPENRLI